MPICDDIIPAEHLWPVTAPWPLIRARGLIARFRKHFPNIKFDLFWETGLMNAQAFFGPEGRSVRLYGGLGRHRRVRRGTQETRGSVWALLGTPRSRDSTGFTSDA